MMKEQTFEEKLTALDDILAAFEATEAPPSLEQALVLYEQGIRLIRECTTALEAAQKRVEDAANN